MKTDRTTTAGRCHSQGFATVRPERKNRIGVNRKVAQFVDTCVVTADSVRRPTLIVREPLAEFVSIGMTRIYPSASASRPPPTCFVAKSPLDTI
jgi:hypothetical protein